MATDAYHRNCSGSNIRWQVRMRRHLAEMASAVSNAGGWGS
ncbi:MAG: hypothetical protein R3E03_02605 [Novosphingobium sp.]